MPRRASIALRLAPVERAQPGRLPIRLPVRPPRRRSYCAARRPWNGFRRVYAPASPWLLARARPAASPSERRPPVIVLGDLVGRSQPSASSQCSRTGGHLGEYMGGGCTGAVTPLGEIGDMFTESVAGVQVAAIS